MMRNTIRMSGAWGLITAALAVACGGGDDEPFAGPALSGGAGGEGGGAGGVEDPCGAYDGALADLDAADLFAHPTVPTFDLFLDPALWASTQVNARDEEYVAVQGCFEGRSLGQIGMRFKGSYGSLYDCFDEDGVNTCRKLSLKLKFSEYEAEQRFYGLKRLNLHGYRYDSTYLKERLAYDLYRSLGVVAPRAAWAQVRVNGELIGLYGMVEQIDGRFTADRWPDNGDGNLFKEAWPVNGDLEWITEHLKTNEEAADVAAFATFATAMASAAEPALRETLGQYTDLDHLARYLAVDDAIANFDGITTYYSSEDASWSGNHNFYIYQEAPERFTLIPWDLESTMLPNTGFGNVPRWTEQPADCEQLYPVWQGQSLVLAPGCDPVFRALAADLTAYRAAGEELLTGAFSEESLLAAIDEHAAFIREHAVADPNGPGASLFESEVAFLRRQQPLLRERFAYLLSGERWTSLEFDSTKVNDFETQDDFGLLMGPLLLANANSTIAVAVNTTEPMAGSRDLLMSFEYANEEEPWEQWSFYRVAMSGGAVDLSGRSGIRLWLRADQDRILRFDLDSIHSSGAMEGIRLGWDVPVTSEATQVEVRFADAAVPGWAVDQGRDPGDDPALIVATVNGLAFHPQCVGRGTTGQLPPGSTDAGFLAIDELEVF